MEAQNGWDFLLLSPLSHAAQKVLDVKYGKGKKRHSYQKGEKNHYVEYYDSLSRKLKGNRAQKKSLKKCL